MLKIGTWPADEVLFREFADGLEEVFVVEEKHPMMENQLKSALYDLPDGRRPCIIGQQDETGARILPAFPEYTPEDVTLVVAERIAHFHTSDRITARSRSKRRAPPQMPKGTVSALRVCRISAPAAPTIPRQRYRMVAARTAVSVATTCRPTWTAMS